MKTYPQTVCLTAALTAIFCFWFGTGCENNSDVDEADTGSDSPEFTISPSAVVLESYQSNAVFTVKGGIPPYAWSVSDSSLGTISGADTNSQGQTVNYARTGAGEGVNTVRVQDSRGWTASALVTVNVEDDLTISPTIVTLTTANEATNFTAAGGIAPYSWSADNSSLGTISHAGGTTATYTRNGTVEGRNTVRIHDTQGLSAAATVVQQN